MALILRQVNLVTPFRIAQNESIVFEDGKIAGVEKESIEARPGDEVLDLPGHYVLPGFIDLHIHGGYGVDFQDKDADLACINKHLLQHGSTGALATLASRPPDEFLSDVERLVGHFESYDGHRVLFGIHSEGPFLNPDMPGAMKAENFWRPDVDSWERLRRAGRGWIKLMTLAPELPDVRKIMRSAALHGVVLSVGHSIAGYEDVERAIDNGLSQVTHIFNGMKPLHHREPSVLLACLLKHELKAQLIADAVHVHPATIQLLYRLKGAAGIIIITDAMPATGLPDGIYRFVGRDITVKDGKASLPDGTIAGSTLAMDKALKVLVEQARIPLPDAARMTSLNPARSLRLDHRKGILAVGHDADVVVLDNALNVRMTLLGGEIVFDSER